MGNFPSYKMPVILGSNIHEKQFLQNHHMPSCQIRIKHNGFVYGHTHYCNFKRWEHPTLGVALDNSCIKLDVFFLSSLFSSYVLAWLLLAKLKVNFSELGDPILFTAVMKKYSILHRKYMNGVISRISV